MKISYMLFFVMCLMFAVEGQAGTEVDCDGDGLIRVMEDGGLAPLEDGQDVSPCIPNVTRDDNNARFDANLDGYITNIDIFQLIVNAVDYPTGCYNRRDLIETNTLLLSLGLPSLWFSDTSFILNYTTGCYKLP